MDSRNKATGEATKGKPRATATERRRQKEAEAARLRARGLDYDAIASELGYRDRSGAHRAVQRALSDTVRHSTDEARLLAMQRLDGLRRALVAIASDTSVSPRDAISALRALLAVEERESKLLGLDAVAAPVITGDMFDREIDRLTRELSALDAPRPPTLSVGWTPPEHRAEDDGPRGEVVPINHRNGHGTNGQHPSRERGD